MNLDALVADLDAYFRVPDVRGDERWYDQVADAYWRDYVEPAWLERRNGLMVRGRGDVARVATCDFPSDRVVGQLEPGTLLFAEHPMELEDVPGFLPLARASFERLRHVACGFYHVHAPLDMPPEVSPSRLCAEGVGLTRLEEYFPIADGLPAAPRSSATAT